MEKMLDFIAMSYNEEDKLTTDDILKLALIFNNDWGFKGDYTVYLNGETDEEKMCCT